MVPEDEIPVGAHYRARTDMLDNVSIYFYGINDEYYFNDLELEKDCFLFEWPFIVFTILIVSRKVSLLCKLPTVLVGNVFTVAMTEYFWIAGFLFKIVLKCIVCVW